MKKLTTRIWGWLVVAAALTTGFTACSSDDKALTEPAQPEVTAPTGAVSTVHVTVGAGIGEGDEATTRADVWVSEPDASGRLTRKLLFTAGDRLFVWEMLDANSPCKYLAGYLSIDATSISNDDQSATFSGDLKVYDGAGNEATYDFGDTDPLGVSTDCGAWLMPANMANGFITIADNVSVEYNYSKCIAADVNTLMKTALEVRGEYNATNKRFTLQGQEAILNCAISGLMPGRAYTVKLRRAISDTDYESGNFTLVRTYAPQVTAGTDGVARFAISTTKGYDQYWGLLLTDDVTTKEWRLGKKYLDPKVYNVTKEYTPKFSDNQAGSIDYVESYYIMNESTCFLQNAYCLLKFKCKFVKTAGGDAIPLQFDNFTIGDDYRTYTISDIRPGEGGIGTKHFSTYEDFQFYVVMKPFTNTLLITYNPHNNQYKYIGVTNETTLAGGKVVDLGTVELVKTNI